MGALISRPQTKTIPSSRQGHSNPAKEQENMQNQAHNPAKEQENMQNQAHVHSEEDATALRGESNDSHKQIGISNHHDDSPKRIDTEPTVLFIEGLVYDITAFMSKHPGGHQVLARLAGRDATEGFKKVGHSANARSILDSMLIPDKLPTDYEVKAAIDMTEGTRAQPAVTRKMLPPPI